VIEVDRLTKKYGKFKAVDDVSFRVDRGEVVALLGPNGAGKTTTLKCILGLVRFKGRITVDGIDSKRSWKAVRGRVAYIPQQFSLYSNMRVADVMRFYAALRGVEGGEVKDRLRSAGLEGFERMRVRTLSEGFKKRLMLATALLTDNPVLIFDEPTSNLDVEGVLEFKELVKSEVSRGKTVLLSTHLLNDVTETADRVIVMVRGRLLAEGSVEEMFKKVKLNTHLLITLQSEPAEGIGRLEDLLVNAGAKSFSVKGRFVTVSCEPSAKIDVLKAVEEAGIVVKDFRVFEPSLEEAFLKLIGEEGEVA